VALLLRQASCAATASIHTCTRTRLLTTENVISHSLSCVTAFRGSLVAKKRTAGG